MSDFNLLDEKWIPVRDLNGNLREVGLKEVLVEAATFTEIENQSPLVVAALYRFLLAVVYRALEGPINTDQARQFFRDGFPADKIATYLERWRKRFNLFDKTHPFGQIPGFVPKEKRAWTVLAAEYNADNAKVLFDHVMVEDAGAIKPSAAARWLLASQTFAVSSGKSELSHTGTAPSATALMVVPVGRTLQDTIHFCLVPQNGELYSADLALWEREPETINELSSKPARMPAGLADLYTWRSRSVRLEKNAQGNIEKIAFASGVGVGESPLADPMLAFRYDEKKGKLPLQFRQDRGTWRDFDSLLPDGGFCSPLVLENVLNLTKRAQQRLPKSILVLGQRNDKALIEFWRNERFVFPDAIVEAQNLRGEINEFLNQAQSVGDVIWKACRVYFRYMIGRGEQEPDADDITPRVRSSSVIRNYWAQMESKFNDLLSRIPPSGCSDEIKCWWTCQLRDTLQKSWKQYVRSMDTGDVWSIRAIAKAESIIEKRIFELIQIEKKYMEVQ